MSLRLRRTVGETIGGTRSMIENSQREKSSY